MRIGVPKEIKTLEFRVGATPGLVQRLVWFVAPVLLRAEGAVPALVGADLSRANGWRFDRSERVGDDMLLSADLSACSPA